MKPITIITLSLATVSSLFSAAPTIGDAQRQVQPPREVQESPDTLIPSLLVEDLKEPMVEESGKMIEVKSFKITGALHVKTEILQELLSSYKNQSHSFSELQKIASLITRYYREHGFFVARAYIPKQVMHEGILEIAIIEGKYGDFHLSNSSLVSDTQIQAMLDDVKDANIVSVNSLERAMLLINATPGAKSHGSRR